MLADLVGEYLFTDSGFVESLSTKNPGLFKKIFEEIKHLCKLATAGTKEARELEKVKKLFEDAYRTETKNPTNDGGVKYSIVALDNGNVYVKASRNVITGKTKTDQRKNITDFFNDLLEGNPSLDIQTIEGDILTITKADTADKARDDYKTVQGKPVKMTDAEFLVKLRAEAHIDELAEISHKNNRSPVPDGKNHTFAKNGFTYRRAYFEDFDGQYYEITLSIGHNGTVATVYNVGKISKGALPSAKIIAVVGSKALGKTPSSFSLPTTPENVKDFFGDESKEDAPAGGYRITGEDIALAPTKEDIARMEQEAATAQTAPGNDLEELGAPTREDIAKQERDKKLKGPLLMKDSLDRELEKLYRLQQLNQIQDNAYFVELFKVNAAYQSAGRDFTEAFNRVIGAYQGAITANENVQDENTGIRNQLRNHQEVLDSMQPVAEIQTSAEYAQMNIAEKKNWVVEKLRSTGYKVERKGFGIIDFAKKRLKSAFNYFDKNSVEEVAFEAIPSVLENGVEIENRNVHKDRNYGTVTIAAPITINGKRGNMAVVVKKTDGNYYKVHRILTPDGSVFNLSEMTNEAESTPAGESPINGSLATPKDSASTISIPENVSDVKQEEVEAVLGEKGAYVSKQVKVPKTKKKSGQEKFSSRISLAE